MFVFNPNLKNLLDQKGYTQTQIAEKLGVHSSTVSLILNNKTGSVSLKIANKLCKLLNITIDQLIIDDEPVKKYESDVLKEMQNTVSELQNLIFYYANAKEELQNGQPIYTYDDKIPYVPTEQDYEHTREFDIECHEQYMRDVEEYEKQKSNNPFKDNVIITKTKK